MVAAPVRNNTGELLQSPKELKFLGTEKSSDENDSHSSLCFMS